MKRRRVLRNEDAYEDRSKGQSWDASRAHAGRQSNIVINRSRPMDRSRYTNPGDREIYLMNCSHNYHDLRRVGGSEKHESLGRSANLSSANPSLWPPAPPPSPFPPLLLLQGRPARPHSSGAPYNDNHYQPLFCAAASWQKSRKFLRRSRNYNYLSGLCGMQWVDT